MLEMEPEPESTPKKGGLFGRMSKSSAEKSARKHAKSGHRTSGLRLPSFQSASPAAPLWISTADLSAHLQAVGVGEADSLQRPALEDGGEDEGLRINLRAMEPSIDDQRCRAVAEKAPLCQHLVALDLGGNDFRADGARAPSDASVLVIPTHREGRARKPLFRQETQKGQQTEQTQKQQGTETTKDRNNKGLVRWPLHTCR